MEWLRSFLCTGIEKMILVESRWTGRKEEITILGMKERTND